MPLNFPHGHGFAANTKINLAGKFTDPTAREILTSPDSSGCRSESSTPVEHSGASSINKTPLCANETAPGLITCDPPPTIAVAVVVWCGAIKGGAFLNISPLFKVFEIE